MNQYWVYIVTNKKSGVLGFANDIERRAYEHKHKMVTGFTSRYNLKRLVYCDDFGEDSA